MFRPALLLYSVSLLVATLLLTSCGGPASFISSQPTIQQTAVRSTLYDRAAYSVGFSAGATIGKMKFFKAKPEDAEPGDNLLRTPDGSLWYPSQSARHNTITRYTANGETTYKLPPACPSCGEPIAPIGLVSGPDARVWFGTFASVIGAIDTSGNVQYYSPLGCGLSFPCVIEPGAVIGQDIWFVAEPNPPFPLYVGYIDASGAIATFSTGVQGQASQIVLGSDGNLWFGLNNNIGRVTPLGIVSVFKTKLAINVESIISGPDGDLWFSGDGDSSIIGRMNTSGKMLGKVNAGSYPIYQLIVGPDNHVWASDSFGLIRMKSPSRPQFLQEATKYVGCAPEGLAIGSNGNLWFASFASGGVSKNCPYGIGTVNPPQ